MQIGKMLTEIVGFVDRGHAAGTLATFAGFGVSLLGILKVVSVVAGAGGAIFGFVAGYFTMRSAMRNWRQGK